LIDWGNVSAGDSYMAFALIGELQRVLRRGFHLGYTRPMYEWQKHAEAHIRRKVGCMDGLALHFWHGPKALHKYGSREKILVDTQFNLQTDLKREVLSKGVCATRGRTNRVMWHEIPHPGLCP
jgi:hypothetical protein